MILIIVNEPKRFSDIEWEDMYWHKNSYVWTLLILTENLNASYYCGLCFTVDKIRAQRG